MKKLLFLLFSLIAATVIAESGAARGKASWYGAECAGKLMANGKPFDPTKLTCASYNYPFGAKLQVTYGNKSVIVVVTDRGPNKRLGRAIDLSAAAFAKLADPKLGVIHVEIAVKK